MKRIFLILLITNVLSGIFSPNYSFAETNLNSQVKNRSENGFQANSIASKPIKAFDRLIIRLNELFDMAREIIYVLTAFILMRYIYEWMMQDKGIGWDEVKQLAWLMLAIAILGMVRDISEFAVGGDVEFLTEIEDRYNRGEIDGTYNRKENISLFGNSIKN